MATDAVPVKPDPGSNEALSMGCLCSPFANNYGRRPVYEPDVWIVSKGCPVHAPRAA